MTRAMLEMEIQQQRLNVKASEYRLLQIRQESERIRENIEAALASAVELEDRLKAAQSSKGE